MGGIAAKQAVIGKIPTSVASQSEHWLAAWGKNPTSFPQNSLPGGTRNPSNTLFCGPTRAS